MPTMTCNPILGPKALVLEHAGMFESKAKKRASPVTIPLDQIERIERGKLGGPKAGDWCRIRVYGQGEPPSVADDPYAFFLHPGLVEFVDRLEAAVSRGPVEPTTVPLPAARMDIAWQQRPMEKGRTSSAFEWLFG